MYVVHLQQQVSPLILTRNRLTVSTGRHVKVIRNAETGFCGGLRDRRRVLWQAVTMTTELITSVYGFFHEFPTSRRDYRNSEPTTSILTITSNVAMVSTQVTSPDGRRAWTPFATAVLSRYGAGGHQDFRGSLHSVAKIP